MAAGSHPRAGPPTRGARPRAPRPARPHHCAVGLALLALALWPRDAWAWTPGTHILLGEAVLRSLDLVPSAVADLLRAFPYDFLYGSIAADTSFAKKYATAGRHCHAWHVGEEIRDRAHDEPLRAFALGYLAHLAADVVAHNWFVPRQLVASSPAAGLGHSYWESRFEAALGGGYAHRAREVVLLDHARSDAHLDRILSPTIFSTGTNRRIFRGMVFVTDTAGWQRAFERVARTSRYPLADEAVDRHLRRSFDYIIDLFRKDATAAPRAFDPSGEAALQHALRVRRLAVRRGGSETTAAAADTTFALPPGELGYAADRLAALYRPARAASS